MKRYQHRMFVSSISIVAITMGTGCGQPRSHDGISMIDSESPAPHAARPSQNASATQDSTNPESNTAETDGTLSNRRYRMKHVKIGTPAIAPIPSREQVLMPDSRQTTPSAVKSMNPIRKDQP